MRFRNLLSLCGLVSALSFSPGILLAQGDFGGPGGPGGPGGGGPGGGGMFGGGGPGGGNFDPTQFMQQMQQQMMTQIRQNLAITNDDEWAVIQALIQKVYDARRDANTGGMGMMGMMRGGGPGGGGPGGGGAGGGGAGGRGGFGPQTSDEQQALQKVVDSNAASQQIRDALAKYRAARKAKQDTLATAQENLKKVLTAKQEAQIVLMGILE
jgi:hypothetical protein